jgi:hypothetical protein
LVVDELSIASTADVEILSLKDERLLTLPTDDDDRQRREFQQGMDNKEYIYAAQSATSRGRSDDRKSKRMSRTL